MRAKHIEEYLVRLHSGQWFGWSDSKNKVYENLVIHYADKEKPSKEWLETELKKQQDAYDADDYKRERQVAYASLGDQLDMQYHDLVDNTTTWKDHISSVKTSFPK